MIKAFFVMIATLGLVSIGVLLERNLISGQMAEKESQPKKVEAPQQQCPPCPVSVCNEAMSFVRFEGGILTLKCNAKWCRKIGVKGVIVTNPEK